jgi:nucleotide-binding universal stress UspA family protein
MESLGIHSDRRTAGASPRRATVPAHEGTTDPVRDRIVVGLDGSFGSSLALRWAARLAAESGTVLDVVSVWTDAASGEPTPAGADSPLSVARERLERALAALVRTAIPPERIVATPLRGPVGEALVAHARHARLLVLGTSGIDGTTIPGPTGVYCLRHSTTPVVFVPDTDA